MEVGTSETRFGTPPSRPGDGVGFAPGTVLAERYRIVALVGHGGMGAVYRADDLRLGQAVALKFLPPILEDDPVARERLVTEVRNARMVSHPNVCRVFDIGETGGRCFLTMEYVDGEDLASLLRRIGRLPTGKALEIARQLCAGLAAAHERGVLHCDLKPANVMIDGRGQARITDFGLAVVRSATAPDTGEVSGTIAYLAPERFEGKPATVQADLYALGLILYETYTGKPAISASTADGWRRAHSDSTPSDPSALVAEIEPAVKRAILRCLEKNPARRPASAAQLAAALPGGDPLAAAIAAGETPSPELVAASGEDGTLPRARAWRGFLLCLAALVLAVPLGGFWHIENMVPMEAPAALRQTARQILEDIGYRQTPADTVLWMKVDDRFMSSVMARRPKEWFVPRADSFAAPLVFCYREGPEPLFNSRPTGLPEAAEPPALFEDNAYLELDHRGRLLTMVVGGTDLRWKPAPPVPRSPDWRPLLSAAGLEPQAVSEVEPQWPPVFAFDRQAAWTGRVGNESIHAEAAAWRGRPVEFRVRPTWLVPAMAGSKRSGSGTWLLGLYFVLFNISLAVGLAILARHNLRAGRGDRRGALRLSLLLFTLVALFIAFYRHWTFGPLDLLSVPVFQLGLAFYCGVTMWLAYLGLEPFVRRRWPHLLIAWTRLLDGQWRDPLVGQSLLAGTTVALFTSAIIPGLASMATARFDLPLAFPWAWTGLNYAGFGWMLGTGNNFPMLSALLAVAVLLLARLVTGRDRASWVLLFAAGFGLEMFRLSMGQSSVFGSLVAPILFCATVALAATILLARRGLLALAVYLQVEQALRNTPLTLDVNRFYFWRTAVLAIVITGVAFWGFRNVLGKQPAFPAGALEP